MYYKYKKSEIKKKMPEKDKADNAKDNDSKK